MAELGDRATWDAVGQRLQREIDRLKSGIRLVDRQIIVALPKLSADEIERLLHELQAADPEIARTILNVALDAADPTSAARLRRDDEIRARLERGDEDSIITFLLFGVTFTKQPRYTFAAWATGSPPQGRTEDIVAGHAVVKARIKDMVAGTAAPGANERLQFARRIVERRGIDPATASGRQQAERFLIDTLKRLLADYDDYFRENPAGSTLFRYRGLSSDTSIYAAFAVDSALNDIKASGLLGADSIHRVAVIGPGLDFTDKQEGHDFYPLQTIQPFAVIDSLLRLGLANAGALQIVTYDVNPLVNQHLDLAGQSARAGGAYVLQLPRDTGQVWHPSLGAYWKRFGGPIGETVDPIAVPPGVGKVQLRAVSIRPDVVLAIAPHDVNIVLQRPDPLPDDERFDLVIATNILIYYDVFEQSLALVNIAKMLRPGGVLLSNNPIFELPGIPMSSVGDTNVVYTGTGTDRIVWYQRQ